MYYIVLFCVTKKSTFNNTKVTFARIEVFHCHVPKLSIYILCLPFYYKNHGILLMQRVKRTHSPVFFFFFNSLSLWSWVFWIQKSDYSSTDIWVSKNIDKIDQVQLIHIEIPCLLSVMKADKVRCFQHCSSFGNALAHLFMCTASINVAVALIIINYWCSRYMV